MFLQSHVIHCPDFTISMVKTYLFVANEVLCECNYTCILDSLDSLGNANAS